MLALRRELKYVGSRTLYPSQRRNYTDSFIPTTFAKLDVAEHSPVVNGYMTDGFIIRSNLVHGSVALLPRGFFNWKVSSAFRRLVCYAFETTGEECGRNHA